MNINFFDVHRRKVEQNKSSPPLNTSRSEDSFDTPTLPSVQMVHEKVSEEQRRSTVGIGPIKLIVSLALMPWLVQ
jgi:hypothetical protein